MHTLFSSRLLRTIFCVLLLAAAAFAARDVSAPGIMEARNFVSAREILKTDHWLAPTLNGEPRLAKPPLPTWITTLPMLSTGTDADIAADRIPSAIMALLMAAGLFLLARRMTDRDTALVALLILAASPIFIMMSRQNHWDIYAVAFMSLGLYFLYIGLLDEAGAFWKCSLATVFLTLSFLSKGPVEFYAMLLPFAAGYLAAYGRAGVRGRGRALFLTFAAVFILSAAWPLFIYLTQPAASAVASREATSWFSRHARPFWFYLINVPLLAGVWLPFTLIAFFRPVWTRLPRTERTMLVVWFLSALLLLSIVPEKKDRYILPLALPAVMLSAMSLQTLIKERMPILRPLGALFAFCSAAIPLGGAVLLLYLEGLGPTTLFKALPLLAVSGAVVRGYGRIDPAPNSFLAAAGIVACLLLVAPATRPYWHAPHYQAFFALRNMPQLRGLGFYTLEDPDIEEVWAAGRMIRKVRPDDLPRLSADRHVGLVEKKPVPEKVLAHVVSSIPLPGEENVRIDILGYGNHAAHKTTAP